MRTWHRNLKKITPPKNQKLVKSKASFSRDELADLLETLAARIRAGEMTLGTGESTVTMTMPTSFNTTMEVVDSRKRAGIERELELEIDWMVDEAGEPVESQDQHLASQSPSRLVAVRFGPRSVD